MCILPVVKHFPWHDAKNAKLRKERSNNQKRRRMQRDAPRRTRASPSAPGLSRWSLLPLMRLGEHAYGTTIRAEILAVAVEDDVLERDAAHCGRRFRDASADVSWEGLPTS